MASLTFIIGGHRPNYSLPYLARSNYLLLGERLLTICRFFAAEEHMITISLKRTIKREGSS